MLHESTKVSNGVTRATLGEKGGLKSKECIFAFTLGGP